jgi:hypothetical protein
MSLPDYEEMPSPTPIKQATADEASKEILNAMVDLYELSGGGSRHLGQPSDEFIEQFLLLAYYIMRHEEALKYISAHPATGTELRRYTAVLLRSQGSIYWSLCDFDYTLRTVRV